ncbi:MAG: serine/threonine-protein kinase, partial [Chloroflexia bacterium]
MERLTGRQLGKYTLLAEIGRGGMAIVYRGYDPALERQVAVKVLAPHLVWEEGAVERFLREARAAAQLKHPNIVTIYDVGQEAGYFYFVMELLEGSTLKELLLRRGIPSTPETLAILRGVASALDYAHQRGVVHRDVKPGNIIVDAEGQA